MQKIFDKFPFKTLIIFLIAIVTMNITYYSHSKTLLMNQQKEKIDILTSTISTQLDSQSEGEASYEEMIAQNLRSSALAIQEALDPDFHHVDNAQLVALTKSLDLDGISLFERRGDDFVVVRSSDPKELDASSKTWGIVYDAQLQLSNNMKVNIGTGLALEHFWSGPIDTASTDESVVRKWGEYFDGTTNYIINPYVNVANSLSHYRNKIGVDVNITKLLASNQDNLLEIAVLNSEKIFKNGPTPYQRDNWYSERLIEYGSYDFRDALEGDKMQEAIRLNQPVYYVTQINGKKVLKSFTPFITSNLKYKKESIPKVVMVAADYSQVQKALNQQLSDVIIFMTIVTTVGLAAISAFLILTRKRNEGLVKNVQDVYVDNINSIVQSIKEQRHDIFNHLTALSWMLKSKMYESAEDYIRPLVHDAKMLENQIKAIEINVPAISAIIQAKLAQSELHNIAMHVEFSRMDSLRLTTMKATDLVRVISNLMDNAFDATLELPVQERRVSIEGSVSENQLHIRIQNSCQPVSADTQARLFESGFSTKTNKRNKGLGLHIIRQSLQKHRGTIECYASENGMTFSLALPLKSDVENMSGNMASFHLEE
ncbi:GHKL domain-containing protein [Paenibacillus oryzisoli]|uniref:sensor histidine kinase n=1 Tax=Paenibacillus oryzisoli TaxID=1850517 RepID=UPI003D2A58DD